MPYPTKDQNSVADAENIEPHVQPNFNGSNTFGTIKRCSRQG